MVCYISNHQARSGLRSRVNPTLVSKLATIALDDYLPHLPNIKHKSKLLTLKETLTECAEIVSN